MVISRPPLLLFTLYLFSMFVISGCAVDKRPDAYSNAITINHTFPAHGSSQAKYKLLQNALLSRNLMIADNGDVLPVMKDMCQADILYRVTNTKLPPYIGQHQDLYSGFYVDVALVNGMWKVVSTDYDFAQFSDEFDLSFIATVLNPLATPNDSFFVRPPPSVSTAELADLLESVKSLFTAKRTYIVVPNVYSNQVEQAGYRAVHNYASVSHLYLASPLATSTAQDRTFFTLDLTANAQVSAIVVHDKPLMACMQVHNFVPPPNNVFSTNSKKSDLASVVNILPSNADFTQLNKQQKLFKSGQYLTINGDELKYSTYYKMKSGSRCSRLESSDPLFKYCEDRKQDAASEFKRKKATMRKQGN
ncbi:hypothetical protein [Paraglaciecola sp. L3A3]|uniref:hypothetical protein n=1 Tax=Paraglaciecola sp. L3A3 TaxID=2686358 RepID=UPI001E5D9B62|nr:hypothetical protein [Paraglaciecola sp. L3A3]